MGADEGATKHIFGYPTLHFIAVTKLFLYFQGLRLIIFSLAGFYRFLSNSILVAVVLQELTDFFLQSVPKNYAPFVLMLWRSRRFNYLGFCTVTKARLQLRV